MEMFHGRKAIIATKHHKEKAIAPILEKELGIQCFVDKTFDTDTLGTFTGEVERTLDPISTLREKCLRAMKVNNCDLGIASEGSFGPHPTLFFVSSDDELLIFIDQKNKLEIIARELSLETNFDAKVITTESELLEFAEKARFPTHALILRKSKEEKVDIHKGIQDLEVLKSTFSDLKTKYSSVFVETDMRAMYNPTRMKVIEKATEKLLEKVKTTCPSCKMPGFTVANAKTGLPCNLCGSPTHSVLSYIYICQHCKFEEEKLHPNGKTSEDPMYCDYCNP